MGLFNLFKGKSDKKVAEKSHNGLLDDNIKIAEFTGERDPLLNYPLTNLSYKGIQVAIIEDMLSDKDESLKHIYEDFNVLLEEGIEKIVMEKFIPWLNNGKKTGEDEKILEGLKLYSIVYDYNKLIAASSPTGEDGFFGEFEFSFESGNDFVKKILQAASIKIAVSNGKVVGAKCFDV